LLFAKAEERSFAFSFWGRNKVGRDDLPGLNVSVL